MVAIVVASTVGVAVHATPAIDSRQIELVANTTRAIAITSDVRIRPTPDTSQQWLTTMPAGANPWYICYADGQNVQGTTKWFHITWNGYDGYYSSVADDVPMSLQDNIEGNYGIPRCGTGADINQGSQKNATVNPAPTVFNRKATTTWGIKHAQDVQPWTWSGCTWFLSQALWYGGFHQTEVWNGNTSHSGRVQTLPGTVAATTAPELVKYLVANGLATIVPLGPDRFRDNVVPEAQLGDAIAYDWTTDPNDPPNADNSFRGITHLALITNIAPGQYPEVSEWGTAWPSPTSSYVKRGWTRSQNQNAWLQTVYPAEDGHIGVTALLLHFNF